MKKRIASLLMAIVMTATLGIGAMAATTEKTLVQGNNTGLSAANFKDLADNSKPDGRHWAWDSIDHVVKYGLFNGTSATTFAPQNPMTRAQFVVVVTRLENASRTANNKLNVERVPTETRFTDVPTDMWCAGAVAWAEANGIVEGYSDNTFRPNQAISRAQIAAFVYRYVNNYKKYNLKTVTPEPAQFTDFALASEVFHTAINYCRTHGLINGYGDHTLRPNISVTRAQVAAILSRIIIVLQTGRGGGGGGGGGAYFQGLNNASLAAAWPNAAFAVHFVAVYLDKDDEPDDVAVGNTYGTATVSDGVYSQPVYSGGGITATYNNNGFTLTVNEAEGYEFTGTVWVYSDPGDTSGFTVKDTTGGTGATSLNAPASYTLTDNVVTMTNAQFANPNNKVTVVAEFTKKYEGYQLTVTPKAGKETGIFTVSKRSGSDSLLSSLLLMNNDLKEDGKILDSNGNADTLNTLANAVLTDIKKGLQIAVEGSTLDRVLQDTINKVLKEKEKTLVEQVTGMADSGAAASADWVTKVEDQITNALKSEVQKAGGTWQSDWRAKISADEVKKVSFQPTEASYKALTDAVLSDINAQLNSNAFSINAATKTADQTDGSTKFTIVGEISFNSGNQITLKEINQNIYVEMLYGASKAKTGDGPAYTVRDNNGNGNTVADVKNPVTGDVIFTFSGNVKMESLNEAAASNPINIKFTPDPIAKSDIPDTPVEVKNFLTVDTFESRFTRIINKLSADGQTDAANAVKKIYDPKNRDDGYIALTTFKTADGKEIVDKVTMNGEDMLWTGFDSGSSSDNDKRDAIFVNPRIDQWKGADVDATQRNPSDTNFKDASGVFYDDLVGLANDVRKELSAGYILGTLNKRASQYTFKVNGNEADTEMATALRQAVAKVASSASPKVDDIFDALGRKAAGITSITITAEKTFNTDGQIGGALNSVFSSSTMAGTFTIERFATLDEAVPTAQS